MEGEELRRNGLSAVGLIEDGASDILHHAALMPCLMRFRSRIFFLAVQCAAVAREQKRLDPSPRCVFSRGALISHCFFQRPSIIIRRPKKDLHPTTGASQRRVFLKMRICCQDPKALRANPSLCLDKGVELSGRYENESKLCSPNH